MDKVIWLAGNPRFGEDPLSEARDLMRRAREAVGLDEDRFARLLQGALPKRTITGRIVCAWETRPPPPTGDVLVVAARLLGQDLAVQLAAGGSADTGVLAARQLTASWAAPSVDMDRLEAAAIHSHEVDRRVAEDLAVLTEEYWCLYHRLAPRSLQPIVTAHHDLMRRLLTSSPPAPHRGQLASTLGRAAMLDGWLSFLLDDRRTARARWASAAELAREFGDGRLLAHVLIARSSLASPGGRGESGLAISLLDEAERLVGESLPLRAWLLARRAEEHAAAGAASAAEARACARDLAAAELLLTGDGATGCLPGPKNELDWNGFRGNCALMLGRDDEAVSVLRASVAAAPIGRATFRAVLLNDLGAALARLGQVDEACAAFTESLALADETGAAVHAQRIAGGARHLERWRSTPAVVALLERLAQLA